MESSEEVIFGYFDRRGRAGVCRNLLAYCGVPFRQKIYSNPDDWFEKDRKELGFEYPNVPYLIDGDKKITDTISILYYIPMKVGKRELIGDTDDKFLQVNTALHVNFDMLTELTGFIFRDKENFEANKEAAFTKGKLKNKLEYVKKNLEGKEWQTGFFSVAGFELFEIIDIINDMEPKRLELYPNLIAFHQRFLQIPQVKAHRGSKDFIKRWFPPIANWNNV